MSIPESLRTQPVVSVDPLITVHDAAGLMFAKNIGALAVVEDGKLVGILTERDLMNKLIMGKKPPTETLVEEIMTRAVITVTEDVTLQQALQLMSRNHIRHLPMVDKEGRPTHMLSFRDLYEYRLKQLEKENQALSTLVQLGVTPVSEDQTGSRNDAED